MVTITLANIVTHNSYYIIEILMFMLRHFLSKICTNILSNQHLSPQNSQRIRYLSNLLTSTFNLMTFGRNGIEHFQGIYKFMYVIHTHASSTFSWLLQGIPIWIFVLFYIYKFLIFLSIIFQYQWSIKLNNYTNLLKNSAYTNIWNPHMYLIQHKICFWTDTTR